MAMVFLDSSLPRPSPRVRSWSDLARLVRGVCGFRRTAGFLWFPAGGTAFRRRGREAHRACGQRARGGAALGRGSGSEPGLSLPAASWRRDPWPAPQSRAEQDSSSWLGLIHPLGGRSLSGACGSGREPGEGGGRLGAPGAWVPFTGACWDVLSGNRCYASWETVATLCRFTLPSAQGNGCFLMLLPSREAKGLPLELLIVLLVGLRLFLL